MYQGLVAEKTQSEKFYVNRSSFQQTPKSSSQLGTPKMNPRERECSGVAGQTPRNITFDTLEFERIGTVES